ncbi:hypothetical protein [Leuconostoc holzapfelii]|uniref:Uncharacterized protein n=1 Tax=Leuconostoc holzapfelii TaxID=434464 RepID=A0A846ZH96_9LACO|nr:hypothetical protein [Leuconostoc holzapfelii]NKZ17943.1 hypothetical protein [Leuconostoc holzapfelii]
MAAATILGNLLKEYEIDAGDLSLSRVADCWYWNHVIQLYVVDDESSFCTAIFDMPNFVYRFRFVDAKQREKNEKTPNLKN